MINNKIGVGVLTFQRPDYFAQVFSNLPFGRFDDLIVVNDGLDHYVPSPQTGQFDQTRYPVIYGDKQNGIAWTKNRAAEYLIGRGCEHIFLIEDDLIIMDENVLDIYIKHAQTFGIHHLNYLKVAGNQKTLKYSYKAPNGCALGFYHNPQGIFSYYNAAIFNKLGYFDEKYKNSFEHIDHEYTLSQNRVTPNFWYFADVLDSEKYLTTIEGSDENSTITNKDQYKENWENSAKNFVGKWGKFTNQIPDVGVKGLEQSLIFLDGMYSKKRLTNQGKRLSIIIPYRDRKTALEALIPKLTEYVSKQVNNFNISVVEQDNNEPFNKGLLNNLGVLLNPDADYYCIHDVDLIPEFSDYSYPEKPSHLSTLCSQFNYQEVPDSTMGGVVLFQHDQFKDVNGYPNDYIFWGSEDNTLHNRCIKVGLDIYQHPFGRYFSIPHTPRISDPKEYEGHIINGQKREDEKAGKTDFRKNGINNLDISRYSIKLVDEEGYKHFKIKL